MSENRGGLLSAGGILSIVVGVAELLSGAALALIAGLGTSLFSALAFPGYPGLQDGLSVSLTFAIVIGIVFAVLGIVAIVGGISAIRRQSFGLSLAGAICALLPVNNLGLLAVIFVSLGKREFV